MRAKKGQKKKNPRLMRQFANVAAVVTILSVGGVVALAHDRPTESVMEKRELAKAPEFSLSALFDGSYVKGLELFFADTFPAREWFVGFASSIKESFGLHYDDVRIYEAAPPEPAGPVDEGPPAPPDSQPGDSSQTGPVAPVDDGTQGYKNGAYFIYKGHGYQVFGGADSVGQWYAQTINQYHEALGDKVQIYNAVIPSPIEFALPDRLKSITAPEQPKIQNIYDTLDPEIKTVDVYSALKAHQGEYLYFATDHHWTALGAYYAYTQFAKVAGFEPVPLESMEKRTLDNFLGSIYSQTQNSDLKKNIDHVDYYMIDTPHKVYQYRRGAPFNPVQSTLFAEYAQSPNSYSVFLGGDLPLIRIDTNIKNGRRIAVVKESYGNAFVPFLVNHYEQVFVVDERYLEVGLINLIQQNNINELLFINNIFAAYTPMHINNIHNIMYQVYTPPAPPEPSSSEEPSQSPDSQAPGEIAQSGDGGVQIVIDEEDAGSSSEEDNGWFVPEGE